MEIKQLKYFKQVYESGSFSKAAERLGITQQGLSLSIEKLENELGVVLFLRGKKGVSPTQIASHFKGDADRLINAADEFKNRIQEAGREINGIVKLALMPAVVYYFVPRLLSEFHELYPHVDLQISEMADAVCEASVFSGTSDAACLIGPVKSRDLEWTPLFEDAVSVMMHKDNPLASRESLTFADLAKEQFIMPPTESRWHQLIVDLCRKSGFEPNIAYISGDLALTYNMIQKGGAVTFVNNDIISTFRPGEQAFVALASDGKLTFKVGLIRNKSHESGGAEEVLNGYLRDVSAEFAVHSIR